MKLFRKLRQAVLGVLPLAAVLLAGCGSALPPPRLSSAESARLASAGRVGAVAIDAGPGKSCDLGFVRMLERTGVFTQAVPLNEAVGPTEYVAAIEDRCSYHRGGWVPILSVLTLGVVPTFGKFQLGYAFSLRDTRSGETIHVPCEIEARLGAGWIPAMMTVLPGWTQEDPEQTSRFDKRLAYSIVSRLPPGSR
ncbi:MAG TPA: hypothetical protein VLB76_07565 [Thermoanaerobaculia bacterium]|jgi:hypothetical protein|nr:hypothetical protein [Thermoanaerobaculia bacterium]